MLSFQKHPGFGVSLTTPEIGKQAVKGKLGVKSGAGRPSDHAELVVPQRLQMVAKEAWIPLGPVAPTLSCPASCTGPWVSERCGDGDRTGWASSWETHAGNERR